MIIFIKKVKIKEGINSFDLGKIIKEIPAGYVPTDDEPSVSYTGHNIVIALRCTIQKSAVTKKAAPVKSKNKKNELAAV